MYSEKTYKNYIFWVQVKRVVVIIVLSCLGAAIGVLIGKILESLFQLTSFNNIIIVVSTIIFFLLGLLLTVGTGKQVQDGYWRIAVLRKLTVIQKNLELNNELLRSTDKSIKSNLSPISSSPIPKVTEEIKEEEVDEEDEVEQSALYKFEETALVPQKKPAKQKKKFSKKLKKEENS
ncbi:MAG: hypothetical protein IJ867_03000 [Clostridia bacterium]|nr:hypothetical protein [Clostridia bacterium]